MADSKSLHTTILLIGTATGVFGGSPFLHEQEFFKQVKLIRWAELAGSAITVAMGWALAHNDRSSKPLVASVVISLVFVSGYEYMIRNPAIGDED